MSNSVLLITGASRGIGAATARLAAAQGYLVVVNFHRSFDAAERLVADIVSAGGRAVAMPADVSQEEAVTGLFARIEGELGRLDALVNNAAILERQSGVMELGGERLRRIFDTNVIGPILCCREAAKRMARSRGGQGGAIVNVSSMASRLGSPGEYVDYAASKGALDTLTVGLAKELAPEGIRVNAVRPGVIYTEIHADGGEPGRPDRLGPSAPMGRSGQPEEVARAILWLLSEQASYTTGALLDVAGGR